MPVFFINNVRDPILKLTFFLISITLLNPPANAQLTKPIPSTNCRDCSPNSNTSSNIGFEPGSAEVLDFEQIASSLINPDKIKLSEWHYKQLISSFEQELDFGSCPSKALVKQTLYTNSAPFEAVVAIAPNLGELTYLKVVACAKGIFKRASRQDLRKYFSGGLLSDSVKITNFHDGVNSSRLAPYGEIVMRGLYSTYVALVAQQKSQEIAKTEILQRLETIDIKVQAQIKAFESTGMMRSIITKEQFRNGKQFQPNALDELYTKLSDVSQFRKRLNDWKQSGTYADQVLSCATEVTDYLFKKSSLPKACEAEGLRAILEKAEQGLAENDWSSELQFLEFDVDN